MPIKKLDSIFKPKRIALIGVSNEPKSVGGITLKNLISGGYNGVVYPVNPKREAVFGIPCYPDIKSLPKTPDLAVIMTSAQFVPQIIDDCGEAGVHGVIIMSAGFKEVGQKEKYSKTGFSKGKKLPGYAGYRTKLSWVFLFPDSA